MSHIAICNTAHTPNLFRLSSLNESTMSESKAVPLHPKIRTHTYCVVLQWNVNHVFIIISTLFSCKYVCYFRVINEHSAVNIAQLNEDGSSSVKKLSGAKGKGVRLCSKINQLKNLSTSTCWGKTLPLSPYVISSSWSPHHEGLFSKWAAALTTWALLWDHVKAVTLHRATPSVPRLSHWS